MNELRECSCWRRPGLFMQQFSWAPSFVQALKFLNNYFLLAVAAWAVGKARLDEKKFQKYLNKNSPKTGYRLHSKFKWEAKSPGYRQLGN